jgi:glycosyltransferase involved in cell wall biosynthesis
MKIYQVFETYPLFYQPYIPPTIEALSKQEDINLKIIAYQGKPTSKETIILPSYNRRRIIEHFLFATKINKKKYSLLEIKALKEKADIVHLQHSFLFGKITKILELPRDKRAKVVITLRGGDTYIKPWTQRKWRDFFHNYGSKVDAFITMSENQKTYLSRWGVPLNSIHVIPISFGTPFEVQPKYPNKNILKLVSVFRMCWEKNIADNLRLVKKIKELGIQVQYDVFGDGKDVGQLYYLIDKYNLNENVKIKGKIENAVLKNQLHKYDFLLQLSHSESLGMSIIEAQTLGVPAIVSDSGGLKEVVIDNKTGFVVKSDSELKDASKKIIEKWENENEYFIMSKNAIKFSQSTFSVEKEVNKLMDLYTKLTNL